jgi:hypothetical protein
MKMVDLVATFLIVRRFDVKYLDRNRSIVPVEAPFQVHSQSKYIPFHAQLDLYRV